jgi:hypothetical protein
MNSISCYFNFEINIFKTEILYKTILSIIIDEILYGIWARKHPSNEGRVSGEGVSLRAHFKSLTSFLIISITEKKSTVCFSSGIPKTENK